MRVLKKMKCILNQVVAISLLLFAISSAHAITLEEVVNLALEHEAQLKADRYLAESKYAEGLKALSSYGTNVYLSGTYMHSRDSVAPDTAAGIEDKTVNFDETEFTASLEQPVIDVEKINVAREGLVMMAMSELLHKKAKEDLILKVHERFYSLLSSIENHNLAKAESRALFEQLNNAKEKLELGFGIIADQNNAEARYSIAVANEISKKTEMDNAKAALEELINQELQLPVEAEHLNNKLPQIPQGQEDWLSVAKKHNTSMTLSRLEEQTALLKKSAAQSRFLPELVLFADYSNRRPDDGLIGYGERRTEADVGLKLQFELLAGGRDVASSIAATKTARALREQRHVAERDLKKRVKSLTTSLENTYQLIGAYQKAVNANLAAFESTQASYDEGVKVLLDVLNAQQDYFRSQREYKTARYEYMVLLARFENAIGMEHIFQ